MGDDSLYDAAGIDDGAEAPAGLVARVEHYGDRDDECTIYPAGADDDALVTRWITAAEGSFVSLSAMR